MEIVMFFERPDWKRSLARIWFLRLPLNKDTVVRSLHVAFIIVLLLGSFLRLVMAWRDLKILDTLFFPDDTYFSLGIARNIECAEES
jgi:hypothetical protein